MRQIQQLVQVLAIVFQLKRDGQREDVQIQIESGLQGALGTGIVDLLNMEIDEIVSLCTPEQKLNEDLLFVVAELVEQIGLVEGPVPAPGKAAALKKALGIYKFVASSGETIPFDIHERIERLQTEVAES